MSREVLTALREQVRRIERPAATSHGVMPFGITAIDQALPGGGLARGALHEILGMGGDEEDGALVAAFAAGILGRLIAATGIVLWCLPRPDLYGPGLAGYGLDPGRLVLVRARRDAEILWTMEEGLRAPGVAAVVGEVGALAAVASRRLQLAAEHSGVTALVLRRWRDGDEAAHERNRPNAAATRWRITALPSQPVPTWFDMLIPSLPPGGESRGEGVTPMVGCGGAPLTPATGPGIGRPRWQIELLRCRRGAPANWEVEVADATGSLSLADALADRPDAPRRDAPPKQFRDKPFRNEKFRRAG